MYKGAAAARDSLLRCFVLDYLHHQLAQLCAIFSRAARAEAGGANSIHTHLYHKRMAHARGEVQLWGMLGRCHTCGGRMQPGVSMTGSAVKSWGMPGAPARQARHTNRAAKKSHITS